MVEPERDRFLEPLGASVAFFLDWVLAGSGELGGMESEAEASVSSKNEAPNWDCWYEAYETDIASPRQIEALHYPIQPS